jgi:hypothetical protein
VFASKYTLPALLLKKINFDLNIGKIDKYTATRSSPTRALYAVRYTYHDIMGSTEPHLFSTSQTFPLPPHCGHSAEIERATRIGITSVHELLLKMFLQ